MYATKKVTLTRGRSLRMVCLLCMLCLLWVTPAKAETLDELIALAIETHPAVQASVLRHQAAGIDVQTAHWQFYPTSSITAERVSASRHDSSYLGDDELVTIGLSQPLWSGGRLTAGLERAQAAEVAAQVRIEESRREIALQVIQSYGAWLAAFLQREAWAASLQTHVRLRDQVKRRVAVGVSVENDLALAQSRLALTEAEVAFVDSQEAIALTRLTQLTGREVLSEALAKHQSKIYALRYDPNELQKLAQASSPVAKRLLAQFWMVEADIKASQSAYWPEVSLRAEHQTGSFVQEDADAENRLFIELRSRFGAGLSRASAGREEIARREAALADIEGNQRIINEQVSSDYALADSLQSRIVALQLSSDKADEVHESYKRQFLVGRKTWLDVLNSAQDLVRAQIQLSAARASQLTVTWRLAVVTGGV